MVVVDGHDASQRVRAHNPLVVGCHLRIGSETKRPDIMVYVDDTLTAPLIIGEYKKEAVSELEFSRAAAQTVSYALLSKRPTEAS